MEYIHDGDCLPFNATDIVVNCGGPGGKPGPCPEGDGESLTPMRDSLDKVEGIKGEKDDTSGRGKVAMEAVKREREQIKEMIVKHGPEKFQQEIAKLPPAAQKMIHDHVVAMASEHLAKLNESPKAQKALKELRKGSESKEDADKRIAEAKGKRKEGKSIEEIHKKFNEKAKRKKEKQQFKDHLKSVRGR